VQTVRAVELSSNASLCVGIYAPWGSGKSFFLHTLINLLSGTCCAANVRTLLAAARGRLGDRQLTDGPLPAPGSCLELDALVRATRTARAHAYIGHEDKAKLATEVPKAVLERAKARPEDAEDDEPPALMEPAWLARAGLLALRGWLALGRDVDRAPGAARAALGWCAAKVRGACGRARKDQVSPSTADAQAADERQPLLQNGAARGRPEPPVGPSDALSSEDVERGEVLAVHAAALALVAQLALGVAFVLGVIALALAVSGRPLALEAGGTVAAPWFAVAAWALVVAACVCAAILALVAVACARILLSKKRVRSIPACVRLAVLPCVWCGANAFGACRKAVGRDAKLIPWAEVREEARELFVPFTPSDARQRDKRVAAHALALLAGRTTPRGAVWGDLEAHVGGHEDSRLGRARWLVILAARDSVLFLGAGVGVAGGGLSALAACVACWGCCGRRRACGDAGGRRLPRGADKYVHVTFNVWLYSGSDRLWAGMVRELWKATERALGEDAVRQHRALVELSKRLAGETEADDFATRQEKRREALRISALNFYRATVAVPVVFVAVWLVVEALVTRVVCPDGGASAGLDAAELCTCVAEAAAEAADAGVLRWARAWTCAADRVSVWLPSSLLAALPLAARAIAHARIVRPFLTQSQGDSLYAEAQALGASADTALSDLGFMAKVKGEIRHLYDCLQVLRMMDEDIGCERLARLVVFVDDLDRCPVRKVMPVLEALILLLANDASMVGAKDEDAPITAYLAIDPRVVTAAVEASLEVLREAHITGEEYLAKIVQVRARARRGLVLVMASR